MACNGLTPRLLPGSSLVFGLSSLFEYDTLFASEANIQHSSRWRLTKRRAFGIGEALLCLRPLGGGIKQ